AGSRDRSTHVCHSQIHSTRRSARGRGSPPTAGPGGTGLRTRRPRPLRRPPRRPGRLHRGHPAAVHLLLRTPVPARGRGGAGVRLREGSAHRAGAGSAGPAPPVGRMSLEVWPGSAHPLGSSFDGQGTNFALFSEGAEGVQLCLFDEDGNKECVELTEVDAHVWHGYLPQVQPGQRYGYRVHGPYDPATGKRFNPRKLLIDPYAKAVSGQVQWGQAAFSYEFGDPDTCNDEDSAAIMPKGVVINPFFEWAGDRHPKTPYAQTVIYEAHVKGL